MQIHRSATPDATSLGSHASAVRMTKKAGGEDANSRRNLFAGEAVLRGGVQILHSEVAFYPQEVVHTQRGWEAVESTK